VQSSCAAARSFKQAVITQTLIAKTGIILKGGVITHVWASWVALLTESTLTKAVKRL